MRLEANNIGFRYGKGPWVLRGVNLTVEQGEVVGLVGPSGCGKTTLGRILAGYAKPEEGRVLLQGQPLPKSGYHPVQLVHQHPEKAVNPRWPMQKTLIEGWEGWEGPGGWEGQEGQQPDGDLLHSLGIETDWLCRWPNELSGGELQRFCVARALSPKTRFLIADEITTMLDAITQAQIWQVVFDTVRRHRMGLLVISHDQNLINRLCSRVIALG
ncbi:MAG: ATP-binding cassette domain-containing protein [Syntrophomonadaceae bacterium]|jgi:peptide/nickel transport system ATP-binding protein|nr:ATP-binding cassette domain-containing protein [Syntrophomonadaceae bacterium]